MGEHERNFDEFMSFPSKEERKECSQKYLVATSNEAVANSICGVCGREKLKSEGERLDLSANMFVADVLRVSEEAFCDGLWGDVAVLKDHIELIEGRPHVWMCIECLSALHHEGFPRYSLANNLWIGNVPFELRRLTIPEEMLIARHYPRCFMVKLYPRDEHMNLPSDQLYTGIAGNASLYELNTGEVVQMLEGQMMPPPVSTLASVIAITFVGGKTLSKNWLKGTFRVRRKVVYEALVWLRRNNPIYADIQIDEGCIASLPEDGVPDELLAIVRCDENEDVAEKEKESYISTDVGGSIDGEDANVECNHDGKLQN